MVGVKFILFILFIILNIIHAKHDANRIKAGKYINHGLNALLYILLLFPIYVQTNWVYVFGLLCLRRVVFDTALNLFRGLRFDYISSSTTSVIDRLSYKFQAKYGYIPYYGILIIVSILSIFYNG